MLHHLTIRNTIAIDAPADKVWNTLTKPEETKQYMFGCETVSDWKQGSALLWQYNYEGRDVVAVKGNIVSIDKNKELVYTVFDPQSTMPDIPANYLTVTYKLQEANNQTLLTVTQGNYATVADGQKRYKEAYNNGEGWNPILVAIKHQAEGK